MNLANRRHAGEVLATNPLAVVAVVASAVTMALVLRSAVRSLQIALFSGTSDQRPDPKVG